nr:TBC1 domain family member 4-like [Cherax quadricarinatus]
MEGGESTGVWEEAGKTFSLVYRGSTEVDRHYSKPMLPWIISEIKNRQKSVQVTVEINRERNRPIFGALGYVAAQILHSLSCQVPLIRIPVPSSASCSEKQWLAQLCTAHDYTYLSLLILLQVLFVGRVKVSHSKVPPSFIDEALAAFKLREKTRQRHASGEGTRPQPNSAAVTYQQEGSGVSVPNIVFTSLLTDSDSEFRSRSNSRDLGKIGLTDEGKQEQESKELQKHPKVRFCLWSSTEQPPESPTNTSPSLINTPQSADLFLPVSGNTCLSPPIEMVTHSRSSSISEGHDEKPTSESCGEKTGGGEETELTVVEPFRQRLRTVSGDSSHLFRRPSHNQDQGMRARAGSIGSMTQRRSGLNKADYDLKMLSQDFNRTMLFHIGRSEIQLINPEVKSVQLNKNFKDIAHCCQGIKNNDHFGFICRELSGDAPCYLGYVFKCQICSITDEIMQGLSKAFAAIHEAQIRERQENLLCDQCPMKWFSHLCTEVEGLPAAKAHITIKKRLSSLPEEEKSILIAKYEGAETSDVQVQNNILMMLLRAHFENKQAMHSHTALPGGGVKPDYVGSNLESSLRRAKKSLTTSFNQLLKREGRESESAEREIASDEVQSSSVSGSIAEKPRTSPVPTPSKVRMEGLSDSPLGHRPRSSTVSSSGGDSMRREFLAKRSLAKQKITSVTAEDHPNSHFSSKRNIFLKVGSPTPRSSGEEETSVDGKVNNKSTTSFRHAILQKVVSPPKKSVGSRSHQGNTENITVEKRSKQQLKIIWKKAVFQQMLLMRFEKENQRLRALQQEVALQRVRLNYEEEEIPVEATQAWHMLLSRPLARIDSNIILSGIKQGIPKSVRGEAWQLMMQQYMAQNQKLEPQIPGYNLPYESMIKELTSQHHAILIDLGRTFPTHPYYMQTLGPGQLALFNLLKAYSLLDKDVGYCQGLSFVGGVLLLHVSFHFVQCFLSLSFCKQIISHVHYMAADKVELLKKLDSGVSVRNLCELYNIGSSTVYDIKKQKTKLLSFFANSDSKKQMLKVGYSVSKIDMASSFMQWCGEKRSADTEAAAKFVDELAKLVSDEKLSPEQVYNADETALYWKCTPRRTLTTEDAESPTGYKASKDRVTVLASSNAAGTHRCKLLVIGKSLRPRTFKGMTQFPVIYRANKKGWITTETTLNWFGSHFLPEARAHCDSVGLDHNCKIMLILDNCSAHLKAELLVKNNAFSVYLPPNCTSLIQPQDNGILRSFKSRYRTHFLRCLLSAVNSGRPVREFLKEFNVRDMVYCVANAWKSVEASTLKNGWHKLWPGLMFETAPGEDNENDFTGFRASKEKQIIHSLLSFASDLTNPAANDLASRMDEGELLKDLEQRSFISEQEIMNVYMLQDKLIKERPKYMKQLSLKDMFKKIAEKHATEESPLENLVPSISAQPDVLPLSSVPDISVTFQDEEDGNPDSPSPQDISSECSSMRSFTSSSSTFMPMTLPRDTISSTTGAVGSNPLKSLSGTTSGHSFFHAEVKVLLYLANFCLNSLNERSANERFYCNVITLPLYILQVQMYQLSRLLHDRLLNLYDHFESHEVTPQLFAAPWFLTLYASQFPLSFVCRVFDMVFKEGMEAVFRVALVLLKTHEEALMACDSFEQIMDYIKTSMTNLNIHEMGNIISQACDCSLRQELQAYEVEYHVLQEELAFSPQNHTDFQKLKEANKNLKRQNLDLLEQLHHANSHQHALETSNQSLQQSQHHLEVRVRWLELERGNLKHLVSLLAQNVPPEKLSSIPPNLQRFLPTENSKHEKKEMTIQKPEDGEKEDIKETSDISSSLPSHSNHHHQQQQHGHGGSRAVSMDYGIMQRYIKNLVGND